MGNSAIYIPSLFFFLAQIASIGNCADVSGDDLTQPGGVYGRKGGMVVTADGIDVCSWEYARQKNLPVPLQPVFTQLTDRIDVQVTPGRVYIDRSSKQAAFFTGSSEPLQRIHFVDTPHKLMHSPVANGAYAYVPCGESWKGIQVIDCHNPADPKVISTIDVGCWGGEMTIIGRRGYALTTYKGVTILDLTDASHPRKIGYWQLSPPIHYGARVVALDIGNKHYFYCHVKAEGGWKDWPKHPKSPIPGIRLVDATEADHPIVVANLGEDISLFTSIVETTGYQLDGKNITCYDLSRPDHPVRVGSFAATGRILAARFLSKQAIIAVAGAGLVIIDTSDARNISVTARVDTPRLDNASSMDVSGPATYVLASGDSRSYSTSRGNRASGMLHCYNIQDFVDPKFVRTVSLRDCAPLPPNVMAAAPGRIYALRWRWGSGLIVLDTTDPFLPKVAGKCPIAGQLKSLMVDGDIGIGALKWGGMEAVFDLRDPPRASIRSYYFGQLDNYADVLIGGYMYYGTQRERTIVDLTNPTRPRHAGTYTLSGAPVTQTRHCADYGYIVENCQGRAVLSVYDYQQPLSPKRVGILQLPKNHHISDLTTNGKRLFMYGKDILLVADVSDPSDPRLLGLLERADINRYPHFSARELGQSRELAYDSRGYLYMLQGTESSDDPRIKVFDVRDPAKMREIYITPESVPSFSEDWFDSRLLHLGDAFYDCLLRGTYLYVASYRGGIRIYDIKGVKPKLKDWEFEPYLELLPKDWSRAKYVAAVKSGDMHAYLGITPEKWKKRFEIGHRLWDQDVVYSPGFDVQAFNVGAIVRGYLVHPKVCGLAVYKVRLSSEQPQGKVDVRLVN